MRKPRILVDECRRGRLRVEGREAHHALRVLRLGPGAHVTLFDGAGREAAAIICDIGGDWFEALIADEIVQRSTGAGRLVLGVATPKGDRAAWLVEKCAELGVSSVIFLETSRGVVEPGAGKLDRWRRKAREAAKQSGSPAVLEVDAGTPIAAWLATLPADSLLLYGDPRGGLPMGAVLRKLSAGSRDICMAIGPEGGFTDDELASLAASDGEKVSLGANVLRIETAAVAAAAIWADWRAAAHGDGAADSYTVGA